MDEAYLDVTDNKIEQPSATIIAEQIRHEIYQQTGLTASAGVSYNKFLAKTGSILVSRVRFGCHVEQRGATPPGMRTFSVLDADCPELYWFGHIVNKDDLLIFPAHGDAEAFTRAGFGVTAISIPEDLLEEYFELNGVDNLNNIIGPEEIVKKTS